MGNIKLEHLQSDWAGLEEDWIWSCWAWAWEDAGMFGPLEAAEELQSVAAYGENGPCACTSHCSSVLRTSEAEQTSCRSH